MSMRFQRRTAVLAATLAGLISILLSGQAFALNGYQTQVLGTSGLVGYWSFEETGTAPFLNNVAGGPALTGGAALSTSADGASGRSLQLTPSTGTTPGPSAQSASFNSASFTYEYWIKPNPDTTNSGGWLMGKGAYSSAWSGVYTPSLYMFYNFTAQGTPNSGYTQIRTQNGRGQVGIVGAGAWRHVIFSWDATQGRMTFFVDGVSTGGAQFPGPGNNFANTWDRPFHVGVPSGYTGGGNPMPAKIDEVALYNRVLTPTEITNHFNADRTTTNPNDPLTCDTATTACKQLRISYNAKKVADSVEACQTAATVDCENPANLNLTGLLDGIGVYDEDVAPSTFPRIDIAIPNGSGLGTDYQIFARLSPTEQYWAERTSGTRYYPCWQIGGRCLAGTAGSPNVTGPDWGHWTP